MSLSSHSGNTFPRFTSTTELKDHLDNKEITEGRKRTLIEANSEVIKSASDVILILPHVPDLYKTEFVFKHADKISSGDLISLLEAFPPEHHGRCTVLIHFKNRITSYHYLVIVLQLIPLSERQHVPSYFDHVIKSFESLTNVCNILSFDLNVQNWISERIRSITAESLSALKFDEKSEGYQACVRAINNHAEEVKKEIVKKLKPKDAATPSSMLAYTANGGAVVATGTSSSSSSSSSSLSSSPTVVRSPSPS